MSEGSVMDGMRARLAWRVGEVLDAPATGVADRLIDAILDELTRPTPEMLRAIGEEVWRVDSLRAGFVAAIETARGR